MSYIWALFQVLENIFRGLLDVKVRFPLPIVLNGKVGKQSDLKRGKPVAQIVKIEEKWYAVVRDE